MRIKMPALALVCAIALGCAAATGNEQKVEFLNPPAYVEAGYPFSKAVRVGDLLFLSGDLGIDPATGKLAEGGIQPETRQTMTNIKATVEKYGSSMDRVVKCTVFLADMAEWGKMNEVYKAFFDGTYPARSALAAAGLALGARVEIECIAAL